MQKSMKKIVKETFVINSELFFYEIFMRRKKMRKKQTSCGFYSKTKICFEEQICFVGIEPQPRRGVGGIVGF